MSSNADSRHGKSLAWTLPVALLLAQMSAGCTETPEAKRPDTQEAKVVVCGPGSFTSGAECLPAKIDCPSGTTANNGECVAVAEKVADPVAEQALATAVDQQLPPADGAIDEVIDPRMARRKPRSRPLLITELQGLESLFQNVDKASPDRPRLMRRLAEGYVELEAASLRDRGAASNPTEKTKTEKIEQAARSAAIKYYTLLTQQYPKFCATVNAADPSASTGCADEALYYMSLEHRAAQDLDKARRTMLSLIQNWPQSPFVPHTYFLFGELFRAESASDPSKWVLAEQSYNETIKYNASPIAPFGILRLGEVYEKRGDEPRARSTYKQLKKKYPASIAATMIPENMR